MSTPSTGVPPVVPAAEPEVELAGLAANVTSSDALDAEPPTDDLPSVGGKFIWFLVLAVLGVYVAFVTPIAMSLAIAVQDLAPGREEFLGYIIGAGSVVAVLSGPIVGAFSDRLRTRWGRRRPVMLVGGLVGMAALFVMASAPNLLVLTLGWMLAQLGWNNVIAMLMAVQADRLPESQRGKVAGLTGFATMIGPVVGAGLGASLAGDMLLLFVVPGVVGLVGLALFLLFVREADNRDQPAGDALTARSVLRNFLFSPKANPDFAWNWAGRFLFMFGVTFNTTFLTLFLSERAGSSVQEAAGTIALVSIVGVLASAIGALGGGFISDKLQRRRALVMASGVIFTVGAVVMAASSDLGPAVAGALLANLGLGLFSSVDQALVLDVLPSKKTDAGRFIGINQFSVTIPQALAPLVAPALLTMNAVGDEKNYGLLFVIAGVFTLVGGTVVLTRVKGAR